MSAPPVVAFLLPGQAMEEPGMGRAATASGPGALLLERAAAATGVDLARLLREGGPALGRTEVLQPLLAAVCLALAARLAEAGVRPAVAAGHSVGELLAWAVAGGLPPEVAIDAAALRGRLMAREAALRPGGMLAVGAEEEAWEAIAALGRPQGRIDLAAVNAPRQLVVAGEAAALAAVARAFPSRRMTVGGAFHGESMRGALAELTTALEALPRRPLACPVIGCADGALVHDSGEMVARVAAQLVSPVDFRRTLRALPGLGVTDAVILGPGRVLRALLRQNLGAAVRVHLAFDLDDVAPIAAALAAGAGAPPLTPAARSDGGDGGDGPQPPAGEPA